MCLKIKAVRTYHLVYLYYFSTSLKAQFTIAQKQVLGTNNFCACSRTHHIHGSMDKEQTRHGGMKMYKKYKINTGIGTCQ